MATPPREIERSGYWAFDWKGTETEFYWDTFLTINPGIVLGRYLVNASFDSGRYSPSPEELRSGWKIVGNLAHSPKIMSAQQIPTHCCAPFDEWWVYESPTDIEQITASCNWCGFSPIDYSWRERLEQFWDQVNTLRPLHLIGDGNFPYLVTRDSTVRDQARRTTT